MVWLVGLCGLTAKGERKFHMQSSTYYEIQGKAIPDFYPYFISLKNHSAPTQSFSHHLLQGFPAFCKCPSQLLPPSAFLPRWAFLSIHPFSLCYCVPHHPLGRTHHLLVTVLPNPAGPAQIPSWEACCFDCNVGPWHSESWELQLFNRMVLKPLGYLGQNISYGLSGSMNHQPLNWKNSSMQFHRPGIMAL